METPNPAASFATRLIRQLPLAAMLLGFWLLLSGELDGFHLGLGVLSVLAVVWITEPLLFADPPIHVGGRHPVTGQPWGRLLSYLPWLALQVVRANIEIAMVVLHPRMPIAPRVVRLSQPLPHNLARLTLASSITLTPGTVTLDVAEDEYLVHALTEASAKGLSPESIPLRVLRVFEGQS